MADLAIVIPAYKELFFDKTLQSIAKQTNKNFTLYIGDDCSPFDLKLIADRYKDRIAIKYTRFSNNIGAENLVKQWKRCIKLADGEKWLWLFSDDDIMDANCVADFYLTIEKKEDRFDVYRFNIATIGNNGEILNEAIVGPQEETSEQMAYHLLKGKRSNSMPDHIFTRAVYDYYDGFVETNYAQGADWATSILFTQKNGLSIIPGSRIYWRYSGQNISATASHTKAKTIKGHLQFIEWSLKHFDYLKSEASDISHNQMVNAIRENLTGVMINHYHGINWGHSVYLFNLYHKKLKLSYFNSFTEVIKIQEFFNPLIKKLYSFKNKLTKK